MKSKRGRDLDAAKKAAQELADRQSANKKAFEEWQRQMADSYAHNQEIIRRTTRGLKVKEVEEE